MPTNLEKLGKRIAKEPHANDKLLAYIISAAATLQADDLTMPDAWENLIYDLECALAVAMARRVRGVTGPVGGRG